MTKQIFLSLIALVISAVTLSATVYTPADVPNIHKTDRNKYISDPDNYLTATAKDKADAQLRALTDSTSAEVAIVLLESIGDADVFEFAQQLASSWGIGKSDNDNGLLILFVMDQKRVRIHTGYGVEGILPDIAAKNLIETDIAPNMRKNDIDAAITSTVNRLVKIYTDPAAAAELKSKQKNDALANEQDLEELKIMFMWIIAIAFMVSLWLFLKAIYSLKSKTNYQRVYILNKSYKPLIATAICSALTALPLLLILLYLKYYYRNKPIKCDTCGSKMHKLNETDDNLYLTSEQNAEEELNSVDYDVWLCPKCGTTEVFQFINNSSSFKECPQCHTHTFHLLYDRITQKPTVTQKGHGIKVFGCRYCNFRQEQHYEIPKLDIPIVVVGGIGGSNRGGGGISGGSFGGGSFGGGGASGGW